MKSMTGYSRNIVNENSRKTEIEIRTVNSKFLNIIPNISPSLYAYEVQIRKIVSEYLTRGTINLYISSEAIQEENQYHIKLETLEYYYNTLKEEAKKLGIPRPSLESMLKLPGIIENYSKENAITEEEWHSVENLLRNTLQQVNDMRQKEGDHLTQEIARYCDEVEADVSQLETFTEQLRENYYTRVKARIETLSSQQNFSYREEDILREVALFAEKADVAEELTRCKSHLNQFKENLKQTKAVGRTLDFILQELSREVTTIATKANDFKTSSIVVHIKSTVEKIREQIQNIE